MNVKCSVLTISYLLFILVSQSLSAVVICYYESWAENFTPEDIDVSVCTHINYAFVGLTEDGNLRLDDDPGSLTRLHKLKSKNPDLKLLFSVQTAAETFTRIAANTEKKAQLAVSARQYMEQYGFDGIDLDWEYPGEFGGTRDDKENFIDMLWVLRNSLNNGELLTVAVRSDPEPSSYNVNAISKVVDYINVMTYDFHFPYDGQTGQNSPLYASSRDSDWEKENGNADGCISGWMNSGADPNKLVLGLAFYGRTFELKDPKNHGLGAPVVGDGIDGGYANYARICTWTSAEGWTDVWDEEQQVPYKFAGNQWVGYDNPRSIGIKVKYAKSRGLGGVMMWAVDGDDKEGKCGPPFALLKEIERNI